MPVGNSLRVKAAGRGFQMLGDMVDRIKLCHINWTGSAVSGCKDNADLRNLGSLKLILWIFISEEGGKLIAWLSG